MRVRRTACVTGSSGQLGREICQQFRQRGWTTIGLDLVPSPFTDHVVDIRDPAVVRVIASSDVVVHTAALHAPHVRACTRRDFVEVNIGGTLNLLEAAAASGAQLVYTSTTSVYGFALMPRDRAVWVTEDLIPQPRDIYDVTKLAAEELCRDFSRAGVRVTCLRVCRYFPEPPETLAVHRLHRGADVRDVAAAHILAVERDPSGDTFELLNIAAQYPFAREDTVELLTDAPAVLRRYYLNVDTLFGRRGWQLPASLDRVYISTRARDALKYQPRYNFSEFVSELGCAESMTSTGR